MSGGVGKIIDGDRPRHFTKPRTLPEGLLARPQVPAYDYPSEWVRLQARAAAGNEYCRAREDAIHCACWFDGRRCCGCNAPAEEPA